MNQTLEKNMCNLPDAVANVDVSDLKERSEKYINPALRYACVSWHIHLVGVDVTPAHTPEVTHALNQLLEGKFLFWLEVLSVLGTARNAVEALKHTIEWLEVCHASVSDSLPIFTQTGSRSHQHLTLPMTVFILSLDTLRSSMHPPPISITQHSCWLPKNHLYENCMSHTPTLSQGWCMGHQCHGIRILQPQHVPLESAQLCGHHAMDSLQFSWMAQQLVCWIQ